MDFEIVYNEAKNTKYQSIHFHHPTIPFIPCKLVLFFSNKQ